VLLFVTPPVRGEITAQGDLFIKFAGGISPEALPRQARVPISVSFAATISTRSGRRPPPLREIQVAINRGGRLDVRGLPTCEREEIEPSTPAEALALCAGALVGDGSYAAEVAFPDQPVTSSRGRILAFNAVVNGQPAILAHAYAREPVPSTRILVFRIRERTGTYGTVLTAQLPAESSRWGSLSRIGLKLHRNFVSGGRRHSYLSANCDAPGDFPGATFSFARATLGFADGRTIASTLTRGCRVRG
jgi:hypothetical protein